MTESLLWNQRTQKCLTRLAKRQGRHVMSSWSSSSSSSSQSGSTVIPLCIPFHRNSWSLSRLIVGLLKPSTYLIRCGSCRARLSIRVGDQQGPAGTTRGYGGISNSKKKPIENGVERLERKHAALIHERSTRTMPTGNAAIRATFRVDHSAK
jgi:hypothetical protein